MKDKEARKNIEETLELLREVVRAVDRLTYVVSNVGDAIWMQHCRLNAVEAKLRGEGPSPPS